MRRAAKGSSCGLVVEHVVVELIQQRPGAAVMPGRKHEL
jgi:hypothetical protein